MKSQDQFQNDQAKIIQNDRSMCIAEWNLVYGDEGFWIYSKENRLQLGNIAITEEEHRAKKYI